MASATPEPLPSREPSLLEPVAAAAKAGYATVKKHGAAVVRYGWVPFVLYMGMQTEPRPPSWLSLLQLS